MRIISFILNVYFFLFSIGFGKNVSGGSESFSEEKLENLREKFKNSLKTYMQNSNNFIEIAINDSSRFEKLTKFLSAKAHLNSEKINLMVIPDLRFDFIFF